MTSREKIAIVKKTGRIKGAPVKPKTLMREKSLPKNQSPIKSRFKISLNSLETLPTSRLKILNIVNTI